MPRRVFRDLLGESRVDSTVVEEFVVDLRALVQSTTLERNRAIGRLAIDRFFTRADRDGTPEVLDRTRYHRSFNALRGRKDMGVSFSHLHHCLRVELQRSDLPGTCGDVLSFSHQRALLPVRDVPRKQRLARRAVDESLSHEALRALIAREDAELGIVRSGGPRPSPPVLKLAANCAVLLEEIEAIGGIDPSGWAAVHRLALVEQLVAVTDAAGALIQRCGGGGRCLHVKTRRASGRPCTQARGTPRPRQAIGSGLPASP